MAWVTSFIYYPLLPLGNHYSIYLHHLKEEMILKFKKGASMKLSKVLKEIIKKDGKHSLTARTVNRLKTSKEFSYLVDSSKV